MAAVYKILDGSFSLDKDRSVSVATMKEGDLSSVKFLKGKLSDLTGYPDDLPLSDVFSAEREKLEAGDPTAKLMFVDI